MGKREQNAQKTRVAILETADRLIAERGYEQISVEEITRTAGVAKGTFYNYFEKKEDLIRALYHSHFEELNTGIDALVAGDACSGLRAYLEGFVDVVVQADVMQARAWVRYMLLPQDGRSKWEDDADALGALLQGLRDHGRLVHDAPVDALAVMLMTHVYGIIFLWTIHPERTVRQEVQDFCRLHLHALLAPYMPA